jgi:hypothetical protein
MMKLIITVIALLGLSVAVYFWVAHTKSGVATLPATPESASTPEVHAKAEQAKAAIGVPPAGQAATAAVPPGGDALSRIESALESAQAGSAAKQYEIYQALAGCNAEYPIYYSGPKALLGKEEAAIRMEALRSYDEHAAQVYNECHRLMEDRPELLASAGDWLSKSLAQDFPKAQTARANELINAAVLANPTMGRSAPPNAARDARNLLAKAVESGEGEVLWMLGELRPLLGGSAEDTNKERWAMMLASCSRGVDCSPEAPWVKRYCKADPANLCPINATAEEMIRSNTGSGFEMIKMRAQEINALIDAGNARQLVPSP